MARTTDDAFEWLYQLADALRAQSWKKDALCVRAKSRSKWFTCSESDTIEVFGQKVSGREAQKLATEKFCFECDAQWDCARWAVEYDEPHNVWGLTVQDLRWLKRPTQLDRLGIPWTSDDAIGLIEKARDMGVPVQVAVSRARSCISTPPKKQVSADTLELIS
jgi:hypothetical protein